MALIKCGECGREVSDKAAACPGCGAPIPAASPTASVIASTESGPAIPIHRRPIGKPVLFVCLGLVVFGLAVAMFGGYFGTIEASCHVGGLSGNACTFTNKASFFPGKECVHVTLSKNKMTEIDTSNEFIAEIERKRLKDEAPIGTRATSNSVCSGLVWGGSTTSVSIGYFDKQPIEVCRSFDNCEMNIIGE